MHISELDALKNTRGVIFNIQYFCIHDGPGIRSNVFFKGCNMACLWCHNPEGIPSGRQLSFVGAKCALCGECAKVCPEAHRFSGGAHELFRDKIPEALLESSAFACITKALTAVGDTVTAGDVLNHVVRDKPYYEESGGGVTFSGGEPTTQKEFLAALLKLVSNEGFNTALETNGLCDFSYYEAILPYVGLFLYDYKETDPVKHEEFTGADNSYIIENIGRLHDAGANVLLRCPIIPGLNDREDHFEGIAKLTMMYPNLMGAELLSYHKLASAKADRLGGERGQEYVQPTPAVAEMWREKVRSFGGRIVET